MAIDWNSYLQNFANLSAYDLYNRVKSQYGDISNVVSKLEDYINKTIPVDKTDEYAAAKNLINVIKQKYNE
jgi:hypothetical protein